MAVAVSIGVGGMAERVVGCAAAVRSGLRGQRGKLVQGAPRQAGRVIVEIEVVHDFCSERHSAPIYRRTQHATNPGNLPIMR